MIDEVLQEQVKVKTTVQRPRLVEKRKTAFNPPRFSVNRLRRHPGIQSHRSPIVMN